MSWHLEQGKEEGPVLGQHLHAVPRSPRKIKKRKQWSSESMAAAIDAVKGGESVARAAKQFGVPRQTLGDRVSGKVVHGTNPGPKPFLTTPEENELAVFLRSTSTAERVTGARVLTSAKCAAILQERQQMKKKEIKKNERKAERERERAKEKGKGRSCNEQG